MHDSRPMRRRLLLRGAAAGVAVGAAPWLGGCVGLRAPEGPLESLHLRLNEATGSRSRTLLVILPGASDSPSDFVRQGFVDILREQSIDADLQLPDLYAGHYLAGQFHRRLHEDVVEPARARGYLRIWLAGVSLGGFGALMYARLHPGTIEGIVALAPFIASRPVIEVVQAAGGLKHWREPVVEGDFQRDLLRWLQGYGDAATTTVDASRPALFMGCGSRDDFAPAVELVRALLPASHTRMIEGGHDWLTWRRLWRELLAASTLPRA